MPGIRPNAGMAPAAVRDQPAYWFCLLEHARAYGDFEAAARAKAELKRLGVFVRYRPPRRKKGGAGNAA